RAHLLPPQLARRQGGRNRQGRSADRRIVHPHLPAGGKGGRDHQPHRLVRAVDRAQRQMDEFAEILDRLLNKEKLAAIKYITIQNEPNDYEDKLNHDKYVSLYTAFDAGLRRRGL